MTAIRLKNAPEVFIEKFWWIDKIFDFSELEFFLKKFSSNEEKIKLKEKNFSEKNRLKWMNISEIRENFTNKNWWIWPLNSMESNSYFEALIEDSDD